MPLKALRISAAATAAILTAGLALMLALNLPGQLSYDSVGQLFDGRFGHYNSWHPPVMAWLLGLSDAVLPGTGLFVCFEALLVGAAFALSLRRNAGWIAAALLFGILLTPQLLLFQGIVWKDVLFADAYVLAFAALARSVREDGKFRLGLFGLFFLSLTLAGLARQNGLLLLPVGALAFGWITAKGKRCWVHAAAALTLLLVLVGAANLALALRSDGGKGLQDEIQLAQIYDLTGAVRQGYRLNLLSHSDPALAQALQSQGVRAYSLQMQDTLEPILPARIVKGAVMAQWRTLLAQRPDLYLRERLPLFWQVLATPELALCHPGYAGISGDPEQLKALGLSARFRPRDIWLAAYARGFIGTPVLSHLAFAALALLLLVIYLRRGRPGDIAMAAMLTAGLAFAVSFFFVSVACDYRYLFPLDLAAMLGLFHLFAAAKPEHFTAAKSADTSGP
jgi:hypothetical protein